MLNEPLFVPPPAKANAPVVTLTVPALLTTGKSVLFPVPPFLVSVPLLMMELAAPPPLLMLPSFVMLNVLPGSMVRLAPLENTNALIDALKFAED